MSHHDAGEYRGTTEAAEMLGVSVRTIHRLVARGQLVPVAKLAGQRGAYLFAIADIEAFRPERAA